MKKLIAIDLDGTTLNNESKISSATADVLNRATKAGNYVTIATGRPYRMSYQFYEALQLKTPMVNFNGALVHLPHQHWSGETETLIDRNIVFDILSQKKVLDLDFIAAENKETFFIDNFDSFDAQLFASEATEKNLLSAKNMRTNPTSLLLRLKVQNTEFVTSQLNKKYGNQIDVRTWGGPKPILEVVAKGIQKARGVAHIADCLGVSQKDVIAFGDEHNDVEMLEYAGWSVAMANGTEQAKNAANDVTEKTNDEDGLADYLENYLAI